jgi:hypothetical protein
VIFPCCVDVISNISSLPEQSKRGFIAPARDLPRHRAFSSMLGLILDSLIGLK